GDGVDQFAPGRSVRRVLQSNRDDHRIVGRQALQAGMGEKAVGHLDESQAMAEQAGNIALHQAADEYFGIHVMHDARTATNAIARTLAQLEAVAGDALVTPEDGFAAQQRAFRHAPGSLFAAQRRTMVEGREAVFAWRFATKAEPLQQRVEQAHGRSLRVVAMQRRRGWRLLIIGPSLAAGPASRRATIVCKGSSTQRIILTHRG